MLGRLFWRGWLRGRALVPREGVEASDPDR